MVGIGDTGKAVRIVTADPFYAFVDGWVGNLAGFNAGYDQVQIPDSSVELGYKQIFIAPDQVVLL